MSRKLSSTGVGALETTEANKSTKADMTTTTATLPRRFIVVRLPKRDDNSRINSAETKINKRKTELVLSHIRTTH